MKVKFYHEINNNPELEDVGKIKLTATIFREDNNLTFSTSMLVREFIINDDCESKKALNSFLVETGFHDEVITDTLFKLNCYVDDVTLESNEYSPYTPFLLDVKMDLEPDPRDYNDFDYGDDGENVDDDNDDDGIDIDDVDDVGNDNDDDGIDIDDGDDVDDDYDNDDDGIDIDDGDDFVDDDDDDNDNDNDDDDDDEDDIEIEIEEAVQQVSFDEISDNIESRPASQLAVNGLPRNVYQKNEFNAETCSVCQDEFENGQIVLSLPCGHHFHEECIVKWLETSHACPLCCFQLPF